MIIIHKIDDFLFTIFPELMGGGNELIIITLENYYTYGPFKPKVTIDKEWVKIEIDTPTIITQEAEYRKTVALCEKGKYSEAKPILKKLIDHNPTNSEYHRIMGQILSDEGFQEEAVNCLIDALRWDSKNGWALIMMGNILAKFQNDVPTAMKYYDQAMHVNPNDNIAINNLGTNFLQAGMIKEGLEYLEKAYAVNKEYPNTIYGIALANEMLGNTLIAFEFGVECLKKFTAQNNDIKKLCTQLVFDNAKKYLSDFSGEKPFLEYKSYVEKLCHRPVKVVIDNDLNTAAKLEYAENRERDFHLIKYKSDHIGVYHLMMHELTHLQFATEARVEKVNMQFITTENQKKKFKSDFPKSYENLRKSGIPENSIDGFINSLYEGIHLQLYNTPIDLFIEDRIHEMYQELRPIQFLSIFKMLNDSYAGVTNKDIISFTPPLILSANKVLNLVLALQFKDLFGLDITAEFKPSNAELKLAKDLYQEFYDYRDDKAPGEEYELIEHWGEDLHLSTYFSLRKEPSFDEPLTVEQAIHNLENDPLGLDSDKEFKDEQTKTFLESQKAIGTNMAVVMFMVDALEYFKGMSKEKIKNIAAEIALQGTQGYHPEKKNYRINLIPQKEFSGYHILAYYYVSWALTLPEMLPQLHLPYDDEYKLATSMFRAK